MKSYFECQLAMVLFDKYSKVLYVKVWECTAMLPLQLRKWCWDPLEMSILSFPENICESNSIIRFFLPTLDVGGFRIWWMLIPWTWKHRRKLRKLSDRCAISFKLAQIWWMIHVLLFQTVHLPLNVNEELVSPKYVISLGTSNIIWTRWTPLFTHVLNLLVKWQCFRLMFVLSLTRGDICSWKYVLTYVSKCCIWFWLLWNVDFTWLQKNVDENWEAALEHNPEAFARVVW